MLVRDRMVQIHRATEADASGIATLHAGATRRLLEDMDGPSTEGGRSIDDDERIWRDTLHLASGDHRPWVAWRGDRPVGFVTVGPSRDLPQAATIGELYLLDLDPHEADESIAFALLDHACEDLAHHGFREVTIWVSVRDESTSALICSVGWSEDGAQRFERIHGVPMLELRYRRNLG